LYSNYPKPSSQWAVIAIDSEEIVEAIKKQAKERETLGKKFPKVETSGKKLPKVKRGRTSGKKLPNVETFALFYLPPTPVFEQNSWFISWFLWVVMVL
jgi:hypothetical protein